MNLRGIVNTGTNVVNPNVPISIRASAGHGTPDNHGKLTPTYAAPVSGFGQIQALDGEDLKQIDSLNLQGVLRAIYITGQLAGLVRVAGDGGDLITAYDYTTRTQRVWLVTKILEAWPDWCKAVITLQEDATA